MQLQIFIPVLVASVALSIGILLYSIRKVGGKSRRAGWGRSTHPDAEAASKGAPPGRDGAAAVAVPAAELRLQLGPAVASLAWERIGVCVRDKATGQAKHVLQGCCGRTVPGDLVALVGPSGAGKSTLLDVLAMQACAGRVQGTIWLNGARAARPALRRMTAYVSQEDNFIPTLSVWETLAVTTTLRLPGDVPASTRAQLMDATLADMGLRKVKHSQVGGLLPGGLRVRGISGGERRRLSLACGAAGAPRIVAADEPTSGLDGAAALVVVQCLRRLAAQDRIVLASVHQPRAAIWDLFTRVLVLAEGRQLYFGPPGGVVPWFTEDLGYQYDPALHGAVPEWLSDLVAIAFAAPPKYFSRSMRCLKDVEDAAAAFSARHGTEWRGTESLPNAACQLLPAPSTARESDYADGKPGATAGAAGPDTVASGGAAALGLAGGSGAANPMGFPTSSWRQYIVLQGRGLQAYTRNPANVAGRSLMTITIAVIEGAVFMGATTGGENSAEQTISALFFATLVIAMVPFTYMSMFVADRQYLSVDPARSLYATGAYYAATLAVNSAVTVANAAVFMLLLYSMMGLRYTAGAVLGSVGVAALHSLVGVQVLVAAAFAMPNQDLAFTVSVAYNVLSALLGGVWIRLHETSAFFRSISYLGFYRYATDALVRLQFASRDDGCGIALPYRLLQAAAAAPPNSPAAAAVVEQLRAAGRHACEAVLDKADQPLGLGACVGAMAAILAALHIAAFCALVRQRR